MATLEQPYGPKVDVWGIGLIAIHLLDGQGEAFDPEADCPIATSEALQRKLEEADDRRIKHRQEPISEDARDFVTRCLEQKHSSRPSVREVLRMPWINGELESHFEKLERQIMDTWEPQPVPHMAIQRIKMASPSDTGSSEAPARLSPVPADHALRSALGRGSEQMNKPTKRSSHAHPSQNKKRRTAAKQQDK